MEPSEDNLSKLVELLRGAVGNHKASENSLQTLGATCGYRVCLLAVVERRSTIATDCRQMAAIVFKLAIHNYWAPARTPHPPLMWEQEKVYLKSRLVALLRSEPHQPIATQLALCIASIARFDFPTHWDSLFPDLLASFPSASSASSSSTTSLAMMRSLTAVDAVLHSFGTTTRQRVKMEKGLGPYVATVCGIWRVFTEALVNNCTALLTPPPTSAGAGGSAAAGVPPAVSVSDEQSSALATSCELALLATKAAHRVILHGVPTPSSHSDARAFFAAVLHALPALLSTRHTLFVVADAVESSSTTASIPVRLPAGLCRSLHAALSRIILRLVGIVVRLQQLRPLGFRLYLTPFLSGFRTLLTADSSFHGDSLTFERLSARTLMFFANVLQCPLYQRPGEHKDSNTLDTAVDRLDAAVVREAQEQVRSVLTDETVAELARVLIVRYFPLGSQDLHKWVATPEQYALDEAGDFEAKKTIERARPAAAHLFWCLSAQYPKIVCPVVLSLLSELMKSCPAVTVTPSPSSREFKTVLMKEAIYHAMCIGSNELEEFLSDEPSFSFTAWYESVLKHEVSSTDAGLHFLRRRVMNLLGEWSESLPPPMLKLAYGHAVTLLGGADVVVALSALATLRNLIEEHNFNEDGGEGEGGGDSDDDEGKGGDDEEEDDEDPKPKGKKEGKGSKKGSEEKSETSSSTSGLPELSREVIELLSSASPGVRNLMAFSQPMCAASFHLLTRVRELHFRQEILDNVTRVVESLGVYLRHTSVLVENVIRQLVVWWEECTKDEQHVLRGSILRTLSCMVKTLAGDSSALEAVTIPLIKACLASTTELAYLRHNVLELWAHVVFNAPTMSPELYSLFDHWTALMTLPAPARAAPVATPPSSPPSLATTILSVLVETGPKTRRTPQDPILVDDLATLLEILDSYIILGGEKFITDAMPAITKLVPAAFVALWRARHPPASPGSSPGGSPSSSPSSRRRSPSGGSPGSPGLFPRASPPAPAPVPETPEQTDNAGHKAVLKTLLLIALLSPSQFPRLFASTLQLMLQFVNSQVERARSAPLAFSLRARGGLAGGSSSRGSGTSSSSSSEPVEEFGGEGVSFFTSSGSIPELAEGDDDDEEGEEKEKKTAAATGDAEGDEGESGATSGGADDDWMNQDELQAESDEACYAHLFARLFALSAESILPFLHAMPPGAGSIPDQAAELTAMLVEAWLSPSYTECMTLPHRKEVAFALCAAIRTQCRPVLELAPRIVDFVLTVARDLAASSAKTATAAAAAAAAAGTESKEVATTAASAGGSGSGAATGGASSSTASSRTEIGRRATLVGALERPLTEPSIGRHLALTLQDTVKKCPPFATVLLQVQEMLKKFSPRSLSELGFL